MRGLGLYSRGDSVEATGLQLQQAVPPILPGNPEVVDGATEDPKLVTIQGEVCMTHSWVFSAKAHRSVFQVQGGQMRPVISAEGIKGDVRKGPRMGKSRDC